MNMTVSCPKMGMAWGRWEYVIRRGTNESLNYLIPHRQSNPIFPIILFQYPRCHITHIETKLQQVPTIVWGKWVRERDRRHRAEWLLPNVSCTTMLLPPLPVPDPHHYASWLAPSLTSLFARHRNNKHHKRILMSAQSLAV